MKTLLLLILNQIFIACCNFQRLAVSLPKSSPILILIGGGTATGKATFSFEVAISYGILKCISTDTIRQVMRLNEAKRDNLALHRTSYTGQDDPIANWLECCDAVQDGVDAIVDDSLRRGTSLVLQGVLIKPERRLIDKWIKSGGVALGSVLSVQDEDLHRRVISSRGNKTVDSGNGAKLRLENFQRIRTIHDEAIRLANINNWLTIQQHPTLQPRSLDVLNLALNEKIIHQD